MENDTITLKGRFEDRDLDDSHRVLVTWGDGETSEVALDDGARTFAIEHQYLNNPFPGPADPVHDYYSIDVTVVDSAGDEDSGVAKVVVNNAAPQFEKVTVTPEATSGAVVVPAGAPQDGAMMLIETPQGLMLRQIKLLPRFQAMLQKYDREFESEIINIADLKVVGKCVRLEAELADG